MAGSKLLYPGNAVAALLITNDGRYILQERDSKEGIFFPAFWGNFGGAMEEGEAPADALQRELREELNIIVGQFSPFCRLVLDFSYAGAGEVVRYFFVVPLRSDEVAAIKVAEGRGFGIFSGDQILTMANVVPYDGIAIWQHMSRHLIGGRYAASGPA